MPADGRRLWLSADAEPGCGLMSCAGCEAASAAASAAASRTPGTFLACHRRCKGCIGLHGLNTSPCVWRVERVGRYVLRDTGLAELAGGWGRGRSPRVLGMVGVPATARSQGTAARLHKDLLHHGLLRAPLMREPLQAA